MLGWWGLSVPTYLSTGVLSHAHPPLLLFRLPPLPSPHARCPQGSPERTAAAALVAAAVVSDVALAPRAQGGEQQQLLQLLLLVVTCRADQQRLLKPLPLLMTWPWRPEPAEESSSRRC